MKMMFYIILEFLHIIIREQEHTLQLATNLKRGLTYG